MKQTCFSIRCDNYSVKVDVCWENNEGLSDAIEVIKANLENHLDGYLSDNNSNACTTQAISDAELYDIAQRITENDGAAATIAHYEYYKDKPEELAKYYRDVDRVLFGIGETTEQGMDIPSQ